jgi:hypothetical protein
MALSFFDWLQATAFATNIRESNDLYPILLTGHMATLAVFGGMLLMSDLRLLGWALTDFPVSRIVGGFRPWKRVGLIIMLGIGLMLFLSKPAEYVANPWFLAKVFLLSLTAVHALVFRHRVYDRTAEFDGMSVIPSTARIAAWCSLGLWLGIMICGRAIGYYDAPGEP